MSCGYGTVGFQCNKIYQVQGAGESPVTLEVATKMYDLGKELGLADFNPTMVDWHSPVPWKSEDGGENKPTPPTASRARRRRSRPPT